jgi:hypothetical protein
VQAVGGAIGEKGDRPQPTLPDRERERDACRLLVEAAESELDRALAERLVYVEKHRERCQA